MKKSKEELTRIHKEKCRELKKIRAKIAEDLGLELHQRECSYEGYCSGTCPACRKEEMQINAALLKKQLEGVNLKGRAATAGLAAAAALCLTGCTPPGQDGTENDPPLSIEQLDGEILPEFPESLSQPSYEIPGEYVELEGDVAYTTEPDETEDGHAEEF